MGCRDGQYFLPLTLPSSCSTGYYFVLFALFRQFVKAMEIENTPIEHQNVPTAHRSLHDFLYSSEEEHQAAETINQTHQEKGSLSELTPYEVVPLQVWCDRVGNAKVAGVYAVLDSQQQAQFVGISRNVALSLAGHTTQNGTETCAFVRVQAFKFPKRSEMESLRDAWIAELAPSGNRTEGDRWANTVGEVAKAAMSDAERVAYEEKKLKLRQAMADPDLARQREAQPESEVERQHNLQAAHQDDWSHVIQSQTQETQP